MILWVGYMICQYMLDSYTTHYGAHGLLHHCTALTAVLDRVLAFHQRTPAATRSRTLLFILLSV